MVLCVPPKCFYSKKKDKCVKPNPYIETLAWCKRNNIKNHQECRKNYYTDRKNAKVLACERYRERLTHVKPRARSLGNNTVVVKNRHMQAKTSPRETRQRFKTPNILEHIFVRDIYDRKTRSSLKVQEKEVMHSKSSSINTAKIDKAMKKLKAMRIKMFLKKHLLVKYFSLDKRVKYYKYVTHFLRKLNTIACIKPKQFKSKSGSVVQGYTIDDIIDLERRIGTDSVYGVIYKTSVKNMLGRAPIAAKMMQKYDTGNKNEIEINKRISENIVGREISRHFLFSYKTFECNNWLDNKDVPSLIKNEEYFVNLYELAHGDVASLCSNRDFLGNEEMVINVACQCLLSIATFHKLGLIHRDTHWGNFLYHIVDNNKGFYHYVINGKNYYLKNCGYNVMLCDFGLATSYTADKSSVANEDYRKILEAFQNKTVGAAKWGKYSSLPNEKVSGFIKNVISHIFRVQVSKNEDRFIEEFLIDFLNSPIRGILMNVRPPNDKVINSKPFIIDDSLQKVYNHPV
jgi:serine/threonine protein kinase